MNALAPAPATTSATQAADTPRLPNLAEARKAAGDFEGLFLRTIIKSFRKSADANGEGLFGQSAGAGIKENWFDDFMSGHIAQAGGVGLADRLVEDWGEAGRIAGVEPTSRLQLPDDGLVGRMTRERLQAMPRGAL